MNVMEFKCPNCGAGITFDSGNQKMKCPYCETELDVEALKAYDEVLKKEEGEKLEWDSYNEKSGSGDWSAEEKEGIYSYVCESCGGEIVGDATMGATSCPYCGNAVVISKQFSGMLRPDWVIPFKVDKEGAKAALTGFYKRKPFLPVLFKSQNKIDTVSGLYVPYWLFNCKSDASMRFNAQNKTTWPQGDYLYTRTDHYMLLREGQLTFERIPADGSAKLDNTYTEAVEPFDYSQAVDFQTAYLAGFLADKYDVTAEQCVPRVNERIRESTVTAFNDTLQGYAICVPAGSSIKLLQGDIRYALLPIWILSTKYRDKLYTFAMNGQTGKFVGELPTDWKKFWLWFVGLFVGAATVFSLIAPLLFGG